MSSLSGNGWLRSAVSQRTLLGEGKKKKVALAQANILIVWSLQYMYYLYASVTSYITLE